MLNRGAFPPPPPGGQPLPPPSNAALLPVVDDAVVSIRGLVKRFGSKMAVDGLNLDITRGSFFGLVGPNGAGKSTTLSMSTGLLKPDAGQITIAGLDVWANPTAVKQRIGVLPEDLRLFERLSGAELLHYLGRIRQLDSDETAERAAELLAVLGLTESAGTLVSDYSQGMRKKIGLAAALLHAPEVLFLDEPFESVDPVSARTIRTVLSRFTDSGATIVFSSHVMALVEDLCDHVGILHQGQLRAWGTTEQVRDGASLEDVFVKLVGAADIGEDSLGWLQPSPD